MTSSLDMIRGRSNIVTLTNNSGGGLVAGDVCIQDATGDEYVTTTTSAASTSKVFVAAETIANGASGKFYESGYCSLVNVNASVTRGRFLFTHTVAKQAAENASYSTGAFARILKSGTTPSAILYSATAQLTGALVHDVIFTIDGGGAAITTGVKGDIQVDFACTINAWTLLADTSGAIKIDVWKDTYANYPPTDADSITNAHEPEIAASGVKAQDTDLADWTSVAISAGDILRFNVDSAATITRCALILKVTRS